MDNTIYNFAPEIFSIGVAAPKRRVTTKQILKKIRCKHLSLEKVLTDAGNYFLFTYDTHPHLDGEDRPEWAEWVQHSVPVHGDHTLREDDANFIEVGFDFFNAFSRNGIDSLERVEVFENDGHIEVLDAKGYSLEVHGLDLLQVNYEEWEFTNGNQAILCWSDFDY